MRKFQETRLVLQLPKPEVREERKPKVEQKKKDSNVDFSLDFFV